MKPIICAFLLIASTAIAFEVTGLGCSMEPQLSDGCRLDVDDTFPYARLAPGMIVVRAGIGDHFMPICHRLQYRTRVGWVTKGDRNQQADAVPMTEGTYIGLAHLVRR